MARTVETFKTNAIEPERSTAAREAEKAKAEEEKRQAVRKLADDFESKVRDVVDGVTNASGQVQVTAQSMSHTAEHTAVKRSEEHTSELQSLMRISYAVVCLKKKLTKPNHDYHYQQNNTDTDQTESTTHTTHMNKKE